MIERQPQILRTAYPMIAQQSWGPRGAPLRMTKPIQSSLQLPESVTVCVPAEVLSVTTRLAEAAVPLDLNVTEMVHLLPAASELDELGQVLVCVNSLGFVPVKAMLLMTKGVVPVLVRVAVWVELLFLATTPKLMLLEPELLVSVAVE